MRYRFMHTVGRCKQPFALTSQYADNYYKSQAGGLLPPYIGTRYQRGTGLGSTLLSSLSRIAIPLLKRTATAVGKRALDTGIKLAGDLVSGQNLKKATKRRAKESGRKLLEDIIKAQTGRGRGKNFQVIFPPRKSQSNRGRPRKKGKVVKLGRKGLRRGENWTYLSDRIRHGFNSSYKLRLHQI